VADKYRPVSRSRPASIPMTKLYEHLDELIRCALPGTMVPVESLAELLRRYGNESEPVPEPQPQPELRPAGLSLGEVAQRFSRKVGGEAKTVQEATVRKWIRVGLLGVRLRAFRAGRHLRVLEEDFESFVQQLAARSTSPHAERTLHTRFPTAAETAQEIDAFTDLYRQAPTPDAARRRGRASGRLSNDPG
jgi:hypothetical protein